MAIAQLAGDDESARVVEFAHHFGAAAQTSNTQHINTKKQFDKKRQLQLPPLNQGDFGFAVAMQLLSG